MFLAVKSIVGLGSFEVDGFNLFWFLLGDLIPDTKQVFFKQSCELILIFGEFFIDNGEFVDKSLESFFLDVITALFDK